MALTYSEFKSYVLTYLWRVNDVELSTNLDTLINQAEHEIDVLTRDWRVREGSGVIEPESQDYNLSPATVDGVSVNVKSVSSLTNLQTSFYRDVGPVFSQTLPQDVFRYRTLQTSPQTKPVYAVDSADSSSVTLRLVGPFSAESPGKFHLEYRAALPDYKSTDQSWLADDYLNFYLFSVCKHCAMFLREDERLERYTALQTQAFDQAEQDDKQNLQFGGSPLVMRPHRRVP